MNTDPGSQRTATNFIAVLREHAVRIGMDGNGCWRDNVFVERLYFLTPPFKDGGLIRSATTYSKKPQELSNRVGPPLFGALGRPGPLMETAFLFGALPE